MPRFSSCRWLVVALPKAEPRLLSTQRRASHSRVWARRCSTSGKRRRKPTDENDSGNDGERREPMNLVRTSVRMVVVLAVFGAGCSKRPEAAPQEVAGESKTEEAVAEARATFDEFCARLREPQPGDQGFMVKVKVKDENGEEYVWLSDINLDTEPFSCTMNYEPEIVKCVKYKDPYTFTKEDVVDWMYRSGGVVQGNFMVRASLDSLPAAQAERVKKGMGW